MLAGIDKGLAFVSWVAAGVVALMLIFGPQLIAEDKAKPAAAGGDGKAVFTARCGSCHALSTAGTSGQIGPNLDDVSLDAAQIQQIMRNGRGSMPSFGGLSDAEVQAVANFVAGTS
jgi:mono/diheme cytochrome c family protein